MPRWRARTSSAAFLSYSFTRWFLLPGAPAISEMAAVSASSSRSGVFSTTPSGPQSASRAKSAKAIRAYSRSTRSGVTPRRAARSAISSGAVAGVEFGFAAATALARRFAFADRGAGHPLERLVNVDALAAFDLLIVWSKMHVGVGPAAQKRCSQATRPPSNRRDRDRACQDSATVNAAAAPCRRFALRRRSASASLPIFCSVTLL